MPEKRLINAPLEEEMRSSYLDYAMSVIVGRALPDIKDGLKPVHRRILYAMHQLGLTHTKAFKKSATVVGEVLGKYHPHGDMAVYNSLVRMAQDFSMRYPLIDGQGNFGSIDGDAAAAYRYTEARLSPIAEEMLADIEKNTVDFIPNFDEKLKEPVVLPSRIPNFLINGSSGIAVGMATNVPPHNLTEVIDALVLMVDKPDVQDEDILRIIQGPDFPTGAAIMGIKGIRDAYLTGRGKVVVKSRYHIEERANGKEAIVVTEIPYMVNKSNLIRDTANFVRDKKIEGIADLRDESDRNGTRIVIELKRDAERRVILNKLFKHTNMRATFGIIFLGIVDGVPKTLNLREILQLYLTHREEVIRRRTQFELERAQKRAHIIEGLKIALDNIDEVVEVIKASKDTQTAKERLMKRFGLTEVQAQAILDMKLARLTGLERGKLEDEYLRLIKEIDRLKTILASRDALMQVIKEELIEIKEKYGDERRTEIIPQEEDDIDIEDLIKEEDVVVTLTRKGWVKRIPLDTYRKQGRGGKGVIGMKQGEEDFVQNIFIASTHNYLLIFTSKGRCYRIKVHQIPEGSRVSQGRSIANLVEFQKDETLKAVVSTKDIGEDKNLIFVTKLATIKKIPLRAFKNVRKGGIIAQIIRNNDELIDSKLICPGDDIMLITKKGSAIRFNETLLRPMGRSAAGVRGIRLRGDDYVIGIIVAKEDKTALFISKNGYGKRTPIKEYRKTGRGGYGVIGMKLTEKTGKLLDAMIIESDDEIIIITINGQIIRIPANTISEVHRATQGVKLINLAEGDKVADVARIKYIEE